MPLTNLSDFSIYSRLTTLRDTDDARLKGPAMKLWRQAFLAECQRTGKTRRALTDCPYKNIDKLAGDLEVLGLEEFAEAWRTMRDAVMLVDKAYRRELTDNGKKLMNEQLQAGKSMDEAMAKAEFRSIGPPMTRHRLQRHFDKLEAIDDDRDALHDFYVKNTDAFWKKWRAAVDANSEALAFLNDVEVPEV